MGSAFTARYQNPFAKLIQRIAVRLQHNEGRHEGVSAPATTAAARLRTDSENAVTLGGFVIQYANSRICVEIDSSST